MYPLDNPFFLLVLCKHDSDRRGEYVCFSSFFLLSIITSILSCCSACFFVDERNILWFILVFFFFFSRSHSLYFTHFAILCSNNSSSSATITTITINYKMIKSSRPMRTASLFPSSFLFFSILSIRRPLVRWSLLLVYMFVYTYVYI
jgi:hypothetical protein